MKKYNIILLLSCILLAGCQTQVSESSTPSNSNVSDTSNTSSEITSDISSSSETPPSSETPINYEVRYDTRQGSFEYGVNTITAKQENSLALVPEEEMPEGTLNVDVTTSAKGDNGLVFLAKTPTQSSFWEGHGISYYFFFVSIDGAASLGKTVDGGWTTLNAQPIKRFEFGKKIYLKVSFTQSEDFIQFHCYVNDEYFYSYRDYSDDIGTGFGLRAGSLNTMFGYIKGNEKVVIPSRYQVGDFYVANGNFENTDGTLSNNIGNSLAYRDDGFQLGTMTAVMTQSGAISDNGIIFGMERNGNIQFWENNTSYYFFFINQYGHAHLGKVNNGSWSDLFYSPNPVSNFSFTNGQRNVLKVERTSEKISLFIDESKLGECFDSSPLLGEGYGIRAGASSGIKFDSLSVVKQGEFTLMSPQDYNVISGQFVTTDNINIMASRSRSIALNNKENLVEGTLELKLTEGSSNDTGIVFRSDDTASNYYSFVIRNRRTYLYKVTSGVTQELTPNEYLSAGYNANKLYDAKIVIKGDEIYCYFSGILYATYTDSNMLSGTKFGLLAMAPYASFTNISLKTTHEIDTADTLIIGHSYMELWTNYINDLADLGDVYNIGIGGSVSTDWIDMKNNIAPYEPETLIYMIGINDFPRGYTPQMIRDSVYELLEYLKANIPSLTNIVLVSVNRTVTHEAYKTGIDTINTMYRDICSSLSYVKYADVDNAFLTNNQPDSSYFTDGLHPTAAAYLIIADAIKNALNG